ncbi:MAG: putative trypsin-like serine protease [Rhodobacteraceae bacterium HLUCCA12]|nr:MAG: putative trypsin-like serine protease [Rhodobacteraceae bacterium HLUCCA12]
MQLETNRVSRAAVIAPRPMAAQAQVWAALLALLALLAAATAWPVNAQDRPGSFADLAEEVSPAVVNITTSTTVSAEMEREMPRLPDGSPFQDFFNEFFDRDGQMQPRPRQSQSLGSGFVISEDGYIVTNNHVIEGADEIDVEFFSGLTLSAEIVGTDPATDLALLKVEHDEGLPFVEFGDSEAMRVGDWVIAVGNPLGQGFSVSAGIVSARGRALQGNYDDYIQTDAAINRGNSGGPLFNMDGDVIGVNTAILSPTGGSIGIGFAMSATVAEQVIGQLQEYGTTRRGWLGVRIQDVTADVADALGLEDARGALVTEVMDGPAREGGVLSGDVILRFDGGEVSDTRDLVRRVADAGVGRDVDVVVFRDGDRETVSVTLGLREEATESADNGEPETPAQPEDVLGMELAELTDVMREEMALPPGTNGLVVRAIEPGSDADEKGMRAGDVITEAGQTPVATLDEFRDRVEAARDAGRRTVLLMVRRGDDPRFVALSLEENDEE